MAPPKDLTDGYRRKNRSPYDHLELLASTHQDFEKKWDARMLDWDSRGRQLEKLQLDLTRLAMSH